MIDARLDRHREQLGTQTHSTSTSGLLHLHNMEVAKDEGNQNCHDVLREQQLLDRPSFSIGGGVGIGIHYHYALLPKIVNDDGIRHQSFEFTSYRQHSTTAATTSTPTSSFLPPAIINARQTKKTFASICHSISSNSKPHGVNRVIVIIVIISRQFLQRQ